MSLKLKALDTGTSSNESGRNKPSRMLQIFVVVVVALVVYLGGQVLNYAPSAARAEPTATTGPTVEVSPTVEPSPTATMFPAGGGVFRGDEVQAASTAEPQIVIVTATPTPIPPTPVIQYVSVEVTRIVEVTPYVLPSPTPSPTPALSVGTVRICASVEGASALYVGGLGVVSGGCQVFSFGTGQTSIPVQINK